MTGRFTTGFYFTTNTLEHLAYTLEFTSMHCAMLPLAFILEDCHLTKRSGICPKLLPRSHSVLQIEEGDLDGYSSSGSLVA